MGISILTAWWMWAATSQAGAQWTVFYDVDDQNAGGAIGQERVAPMRQALDRVKSKLEKILTGSTGDARIVVRWENPQDANAVADASASANHLATVAVAKDKLTNQATADSEPASEILLYESLPASAVPYRFEAETTLSATHVGVPNALNKHLGFQPTTNQTDGTIRFRPPSGTLKWQFWEKRGSPLLPEHELFESVALHESLHLLGFTSIADATIAPGALFSWDLFRFADASIPVNAASFETLPRELRPTVEATGITLLGSTTSAYKLSRGTRTGGDGFQASHWRSLSRLNPANSIGVMDPAASAVVYASLAKRLYTRADVEALDVIGWNVNPDAVQYAAGGPVNLVSPAAGAQFPTGAPIVFSWESGSFNTWSVYIYPGETITDDNPARIFYQLPIETTSVTLEASASLPPGQYVWSVVGATDAGYADSDNRLLTILPACDPDITCDGNIDQDDIACLVAVVAGNSGCECVDPDFNHDGNLDQDDIALLVDVVAGTPCP